MNPARKRRPGVILSSRILPGRYPDETEADGGRKSLHRQVRHAEKRLWLGEARQEIAALGIRTSR